MGKCDYEYNEPDLIEILEEGDEWVNTYKKIGVNISPERIKQIFYNDCFNKTRKQFDNIEFRKK